ncbi:fatty acid synthase-like [Harpegnathos saltator]|uniref:fatty acid synthase-like n=1 Tax=Harpegnathos saltator TaxID=610380 RepID=UPI000DBEF0BD|nr:fatty acid synthase-like [Harpegnathos saltator]
MNAADIYKELRLRGYQYNGLFRSLKSSSINGSTGHITWATNWVAFMDNMLQIKLLSVDSRNLYVPTQIRKLVIDPAHHMTQFHNLSIEERNVPVRVYDSFDAIISGGIEICGLKSMVISRRSTNVESVHEEYKFIAHRDHNTISLKDAVQISIHIALECYNLRNVKVIEFVEDDDKILLEDLVIPIVDKVLSNLPLVRSNLTLAAMENRFDCSLLPQNLSVVQPNKLLNDGTFLMVVGVGVLTKGAHTLLSNIMAGGFLFTREDLNVTYDNELLQQYNLNIILEKRTERELVLLLRKAQSAIIKREIVHINNYEFSWIEKLKSSLDTDDETNSRVTLVVEDDPECGVIGFVNCLRKEPGGDTVRCVFIQDKNAPKFSLQEPFYMNQLRLDLPINVLRPGKVWGSYRHLSLPPPEPIPVQCGYVAQRIRGDMSTIRWVEGRTSPKLNRENMIHKIYVALNFKDIMIATGKLALESFQMIEREIDSFLGFEFVGYDGFGQRIMAICSDRGISNVAIQDRVMSWVIPDEWTFEDAATVPCVYATSCYALYEKGKMKRGDKVLIHSGTGGIGQAAIHLALYEKCEVFTTVGTLKKRQFIRETFPSILDDHIGNSRDTSFEQMILEQTRGRGVDIVLNSLAEEKLQASIRCLAKGGRFLEIGKYDLIADNTLDRMIFTKGISFHAIMLDNIISSVSKNYGIVYNYVLQCLKNGSIKPLPRKVFEKTEVEDAFRYMATAALYMIAMKFCYYHSYFQILIKICDENEPLSLPILAYPRFFCKSHMSYIILGGLGGFGLELADWLILRGAKNLLLTSRTGLRNGYQRSRVELWKSYGVNVQIIASAEASDHKDGASILNTAIEMGPVDAIFNLAVVLKDSLYKNQTTESFEESFKPKAMATKTMDELSRKMCPDLRYFVVFSSVSCGRGNSGQTNYGMANSIMERICERRVQDGLPGMAIQWGAVGDVGLVADMQKDNKELIIGGTLQQKIQSCLQSLDTFMVLNKPIVGSMVVAEKRATFGGVMDIMETVASIMGIKDVKAVGLRTPLSEMGMDSMMAVEIKQTLEKEFDVYLTAQDIRTLTLEKLHNMADKDKRFEQIETLDSEGIKFLIRLINNLDIVPDVCLETTTRNKMGTKRIFLLPGIEGCGSVFNLLASKIEGPVTCLQHGANNIPTSESVLQSAASLLPHIISKMEGSAEFIIVGYSYGSLIAIELMRLLEARNFTGRLILIDGTPDYMKTLKDQYFPFTNLQEFQNNVLLGLIDLFYSVDNTSVLLELSKHDTWEKKWDAVVKCLSDDIVQVTSLENYKIYCTTIYKHLIAIHEYDASSLPPLKSPILLLKPTTSNLPSADENSDLKKVTEGNVQVRRVEGNHLTMLENDELADIINEILS